MADGTPTLAPVDHRHAGATSGEDAELLGRLLGAPGERRRGMVVAVACRRDGVCQADVADELGITREAVPATCLAGLRRMHEAAQRMGLTA